MTTDAPNTTDKSEKKRGYEEGGQKIELLRARWPKAFPAKSHEVRPLTNGAQQTMVEEFGWSPVYARAVLTVWKLRPSYCQAILRYPTRDQSRRLADWRRSRRRRARHGKGSSRRARRAAGEEGGKRGKKEIAGGG